MTKPLTTEQKEVKAARDKVHSQKRAARERRCVTHHLVKHRKAARPSAYDKEPMATGHGDGEETRRDIADKLMRQSIRIKFQEYAP